MISYFPSTGFPIDPQLPVLLKKGGLSQKQRGKFPSETTPLCKLTLLAASIPKNNLPFAALILTYTNWVFELLHFFYYFFYFIIKS